MLETPIQRAAAAFIRDDMASAADILSERLAGKAVSQRAADEVRLVRAMAQLRGGDSAASLATLAAIESDLRSDPACWRTYAAAFLAAGDPGKAVPFLEELVRAGYEDAGPVCRAALVRHGLSELGKGNVLAAVSTLTRADLPRVENPTTRRAGWVGLLDATLRSGSPHVVPAVFALCPELREDPIGNLLAARAAIARMDVADATDHLLAAPEHDECHSLYWALARDLFKSDRFEELVAVFDERAAGPSPDEWTRSIAVLVAHALRGLGRVPEGRLLMANLVGQHPDDAKVLHHAGLFEFLCGERRAADALLRRLKVRTESAMLLLWEIVFLEGEHQAVRDSLLAETVGQWSAGPLREVARLLAATSCARVGDADRAAAHLAGQVAAHVPESMRVGSACLNGYVALARGDAAKAVEMLAGTPWLDLARLEHARALSDLGDQDRASAGLEDLLERGVLVTAAGPSLGRVRLRMAAAAVAGRDVDSARELLAMVRRDTPSIGDEAAVFEDHVGIISLMEDGGMDTPSLGERFWNLAGTPPRGLPPGAARSRRRDLSFLAAVLWILGPTETPEERERNLTRAATALDAALGIEPGFAPAAAVLGVLLHLRGHGQRALRLLEAVRTRYGEHPGFLSVLASQYVRAGRYVEAKGILFDLIGTSSDRPGIQRTLAGIASAEQRAFLLVLRDDEANLPPVEFPEGRGEPGSGALDLFGGAPALPRAHLLRRRIEEWSSATPTAFRAKWSDIERALKRSVIEGSEAGVLEAERNALALLASVHGG